MSDEEQVHETWTDKNKAIIRLIQGTIVGVGVLVAAIVFGSHVLEDGTLTITEAIFVGGLAIIGVVAILPSTFAPFLNRAITYVQKRGGA